MNTAVCRNALSCFRLVRNYAVQASNPAILGLGKKMKKGAVAVAAKQEMAVETDVNRLVSYVCGSNIFKEGEDVKIKPDSEYPDWLWNVYTGPRKTLKDYKFGTKQYYEKLKRIQVKKAVKLGNIYRKPDY